MESINKYCTKEQLLYYELLLKVSQLPESISQERNSILYNLEQFSNIIANSFTSEFGLPYSNIQKRDCDYQNKTSLENYEIKLNHKRSIAILTFISKSDQIISFEITYFLDFLKMSSAPWHQDGLINKVKYQFINPDIMIKTISKYDGFSLNISDPFIRDKEIIRYKDNQVITKDTYRYNKLVKQEVYDYQEPSKYYSKNRNYPLPNTYYGVSSSNQFDKRYKEALKLTKERK